jgi:hypothetical protein
MHHPLSHKVTSTSFFNGARPSSNAYIWDAMVNAQRWYFQKTADIINEFRTTIDPQDPSGGSLLDNMVIPMVTEVAEANHTRDGHAAVIFGGKNLGMQGGQYLSVSGNHNQFWLAVAQAYLGENPQTTLASESFYKTNLKPTAGLWVKPG